MRLIFKTIIITVTVLVTLTVSAGLLLKACDEAGQEYLAQQKAEEDEVHKRVMKLMDE